MMYLLYEDVASSIRVYIYAVVMVATSFSMYYEFVCIHYGDDVKLILEFVVTGEMLVEKIFLFKCILLL